MLIEHAELLSCPACHGPLLTATSSFVCYACERTFGCDSGVPLLYWPSALESARSDISETVRAFYEQWPFPNYDEVDSLERLREKARRGVFARLLDEQIPHDAKILEVGCGTGQLSNFLGSTWGRSVFATDICLNSLKLGQAFKAQNHIEQTVFMQMNLFQPVFKAASFDVVICTGVLHHTSEPARGFQTIANLVKVGGFIIIGLYNTFGRIPTKVRQLYYRLSGNHGHWLDHRLTDQILSPVKKQAWFVDQYQHPHESTHTFGQALEWFRRAGIEVTTTIPKACAFEPFADDERLFEVHPPGSRLDRFLVQLGMLLGGGKEGGFFVVIGRKTHVE